MRRIASLTPHLRPAAWADRLDRECARVLARLLARARRYDQARLELHDRARAMHAVVAAALEMDLELLGLTGVEDKLQVPAP